MPVAFDVTLIPAPRFPETTLPKPCPGEPIMFPDPDSIAIPLREFPSAVVPRAVVPIQLPLITLADESVPSGWIRMPSPVLPEMTLPDPPAPRPIVLRDEPRIESPCPFGIATLPIGATPR